MQANGISRDGYFDQHDQVDTNCYEDTLIKAWSKLCLLHGCLQERTNVQLIWRNWCLWHNIKIRGMKMRRNCEKFRFQKVMALEDWMKICQGKNLKMTRILNCCYCLTMCTLVICKHNFIQVLKWLWPTL